MFSSVEMIQDIDENPFRVREPRGIEGMPGLLHDFMTDCRWREGMLRLNWGLYELSSAFQPIVSFSHGQVVAHEALLRASDPAGRNIPPAMLFNPLAGHGDLLHLDRASRLMHIVNARQAPGCFFLNLHPRLFDSLREVDSLATAKAIGEFASSGHSRYIVEIVEEEITDHAHFEEGVAVLRSVGMGVALDDFGAGHSNFDRVWKIRPDVVKLDRSFAARAAEDRSVCRLLPQIVSILHEAGTLVLLEGIETLEQARIAMDSNVDFGQGWYFAHPAAHPTSTGTTERMEAIWTGAGEASVAADHSRWLLAPYQQALRETARRLMQGHSLGDAAPGWKALPHVCALYVLDADGRQEGHALEFSSGGQPPAGFCLGHVPGACWASREHFIEAVRVPGETHLTRPYLSVASGRVCVTVSIGIMAGARRVVVCGDVDWAELENSTIRPRAVP